MQHTTNYNLSQYDATDRVTRDAFNADNLAIDAALKSVSDAAGAAQSTANSAASTAAAAPRLVTGTYVGNGQVGAANARTLTFSSKPQVVFISSSSYQLLAIQGGFAAIETYGNNIGDFVYLTWSGNSLSWYVITSDPRRMMNSPDTTYHYVALLSDT